MLKQFEESDCERAVLFFDPGSGGNISVPKSKEVLELFSHEELAEFFGRAEQAVCFTACDASEQSLSSGKLKHGIWAAHLIEAFADKAPAAPAQKTLLTPASLQSYLVKAVQRTLR